MPLARVLEHDDCCPLLLSLLSPARIGALLQTCRSFYGARPRAGASASRALPPPITRVFAHTTVTANATKRAQFRHMNRLFGVLLSRPRSNCVTNEIPRRL